MYYYFIKPFNKFVLKNCIFLLILPETLTNKNNYWTPKKKPLSHQRCSWSGRSFRTDRTAMTSWLPSRNPAFSCGAKRPGWRRRRPWGGRGGRCPSHRRITARTFDLAVCWLTIDNFYNIKYCCYYIGFLFLLIEKFYQVLSFND